MSEDKDISIKHIIRIIMEAAFDCALNYFRNHITGHDGERECDYVSCDYKCNGVNMTMIEDGLPNDQLDYSTYQLYYANPQVIKIQKKIEHLLRRNIKMDLESIKQNLKDEFSEWQVENALQTLITTEKSAEYDYRQFLEVYSRSSVQKIMPEVEKLFKSYFYLDLYTIQDQFAEYTDFEVLTALRTLINESVVIINRYGFPSYLKEENNVYFLVNNLAVSNRFSSGFYTRYPNIVVSKTFDNLKQEIYVRTLPEIIRKFCKVTKPKDFSRIIKTLPIQVQEMFIEIALVAEDRGVPKNAHIREMILEYFKNDIKRIGNTVVSTLREGDEILRCREVDQDDWQEWQNCPPGFERKIQRHEAQQEARLREDNPYKLIGKWNPKLEKFCLVDLEREAKGKKKIKRKKKGDTGVADTRAVHTGKVCADGGWKLPQLLNIMIKRLKVPAPPEFRATMSETALQRLAKTDSKLKYLRKILTEEEIDAATKDELRMAMYWCLEPNQGGKRRIALICTAMKEWMDKNGILQDDAQCGHQIKKKKVRVGKKSTGKYVYWLDRIIPSAEPVKFKSIKLIAPLMKDCFKIDRYSHEINDDEWFMAYVKKKLVGFIVVRDDKIISACIAKGGYRRKGVPKEAMKFLTNAAGTTTLEFNNRTKLAKSLLRQYKIFGFVATKNVGGITTMEYTE
jgi:hypothetical protein